MPGSLLKSAGTDLAYYTTSLLLQPLSIRCELAPYFSVYKEVTATNTNFLALALTAFKIISSRTEKVAPSPSVLLWYSQDLCYIFICMPCCDFALMNLTIHLRASVFGAAGYGAVAIACVESMILTQHVGSIGSSLFSIVATQQSRMRHVTHTQQTHTLHFFP